MGIIRKIYDTGENAINTVKKKFENPLRDFEKEINNLKSFLKESKSIAAHLNALKIRVEKDIEDYKKQIIKYQQKAEDAVKKAFENLISEETAETISVNALKFKKSYKNRIEELKNKVPVYDEELKSVKEKISDLKIKIEYYENEYNFLKTRTEKEGNTLDDLFHNDSSIISRLEKLKDAILKQNSKKDIYAEKSEEMYGDIQKDDVYDEYAELKKKFKK